MNETVGSHKSASKIPVVKDLIKIENEVKKPKTPKVSDKRKADTNCKNFEFEQSLK